MARLPVVRSLRETIQAKELYCAAGRAVTTPESATRPGIALTRFTMACGVRVDGGSGVVSERPVFRDLISAATVAAGR